MARVTIEDCIKQIQSRFELVVLATRRARNITAGASITVDREDDKNAVVSLREIAEGSVDIDDLREQVIKQLQKNLYLEETKNDQQELSEERLKSTVATKFKTGRKDKGTFKKSETYMQDLSTIEANDLNVSEENDLDEMLSEIGE